MSFSTLCFNTFAYTEQFCNTYQNLTTKYPLFPYLRIQPIDIFSYTHKNLWLRVYIIALLIEEKNT